MQEISDELLAGRAKRGEAKCFEELVRRYQAPLRNFLHRRFNHRRDADDILQEGFLRAFQRLHQYSDAWPFKTWLFTIVHRLGVRHDASATASADSFTRTHANEAVDPGGQPFDCLEKCERRQGLWDIARRVLTSEQFTAIWLFYVEDAAVAEIAQVLDRTVGSVKTMLHRARKELTPYLAEEAMEPKKAVQSC